MKFFLELTGLMAIMYGVSAADEEVCGSGICLEESRCVFEGAVKGPSCGDAAVWCSCGDSTIQGKIDSVCQNGDLAGFCKDPGNCTDSGADQGTCSSGLVCCDPSIPTSGKIDSVCQNGDLAGFCKDPVNCTDFGADQGTCSSDLVCCVTSSPTTATICRSMHFHEPGLYGICANSCSTSTHVIAEGNCRTGEECCQPMGDNAPCSDFSSRFGIRESQYGTCQRPEYCKVHPNAARPSIGSCGDGFFCCVNPIV